MVIGGGTYAYDFGEIEEGYGIKSFWGDDYEALILQEGTQVGAVWELDELFPDDEEEEDEEGEW